MESGSPAHRESIVGLTSERVPRNSQTVVIYSFYRIVDEKQSSLLNLTLSDQQVAGCDRQQRLFWQEVVGASETAEITMVNCTEFLQKRLCCFVANRPKEAVSYAWMASLVCSTCPFVRSPLYCASEPLVCVKIYHVGMLLL